MVSISSGTSLYDGGTDVPPPPPPSVQPQSVQREPEIGYSPNFPSSSSEASVTIKGGGASFQSTINPDEGSIKSTVALPVASQVSHQWKSESTKKPDLLGIEHELNINAVAEYSVASGKVIKNGQAEFTIEKTFIEKIEAGSTLAIDKTNTEITLDILLAKVCEYATKCRFQIQKPRMSRQWRLILFPPLVFPWGPR